MSIEVLTRPDAGWSLSLYPSAGEAGGAFVPSVRPRRTYIAGTPAADPARARAEAGRRARAKVRRYCAANRLDKLGTLTYRGAGCHDPAQARADVAVFIRSLRELRGGKPFPYVWVPEWHKTGHGLHLHFAVGQYIPRGMIERAWGRGYIDIRRISNLPVGSTSLHGARRAAGYLSKYVTKAFDDQSPERLGRLHRYEVGQGFQPPVMRFRGDSSHAVLLDAVAEMGGQFPARSWSSAEKDDWQGAPAVWFAWD